MKNVHSRVKSWLKCLIIAPERSRRKTRLKCLKNAPEGYRLKYWLNAPEDASGGKKNFYSREASLLFPDWFLEVNLLRLNRPLMRISFSSKQAISHAPDWFLWNVPVMLCPIRQRVRLVLKYLMQFVLLSVFQRFCAFVELSSEVIDPVFQQVRDCVQKRLQSNPSIEELLAAWSNFLRVHSVNCLYSSGRLMVGSHLVLALASWQQPRWCAQRSICRHED